jgi:hypothetical protein
VRKKASRGYEVTVVKTHKATVLHIITKEVFFSIKITVISHVIKEPSFIVTHPFFKYLRSNLQCVLLLFCVLWWPRR